MVNPAGRKAIRRFYEPLLLLDGLGHIRGDRTPSQPPNDGDDADASQAARKFADALAYFCAFAKGPDHVTAIALEKDAPKVKVWVAANKSVKPNVAPFLETLLLHVRDVANLTDEEQIDNTINAAVNHIITFNIQRLNEYHKMITPLGIQLRNAQAGLYKGELPASQIKRFDALMAWITRNFETRGPLSANEWCGFVRECHKRRDTFTVLNEIGLPKSQKVVLERLEKLLWKLGKHITLSRRLFDATRELSWEFSKGFVVDLVPSPPGQKAPLRGQEATVYWILHRMFAKEEEKEQFRAKLQSIHRADMIDQEIHKIRDTQCRIHAELVLLEHLHDRGCDFLDPEDKYIGVSKPACYLCHAYIKLHPGRFVVPRSHQKSWIGWRPPGVDLETYYMTPSGRGILMELIEVVRNKVKEEVRDRSHRQEYREDSTKSASSARDSAVGASKARNGIPHPVDRWRRGVPENAADPRREPTIPSLPPSYLAPTLSEGYNSTAETTSGSNTCVDKNKIRHSEDKKASTQTNVSSLERRARKLKIVDETERTKESNNEDTEDDEGGIQDLRVDNKIHETMLREVKPRNARSARALKAREPKEREGPKSALFLKSSASSSLANDIAKDLCALKKPHAVQFSKKNEGIHPFEDASSLEFFSNKNDAPLLCFASHSKKRPHTLTFVRTFDAKVLDMLECTIVPETTRAARQFGGRSLRTGIKPMLAFSGEQFEEGGGEGAARFRLAKSMFADFFRGEETTQVDVEGLQALISFAAAETPVLGADPVQTVHMRVWRLVTKRSGQRLPRVELEEIGPRVDFRLRRVREADPEVLKVALKVAKGSEPKTKKNIDMDALGDKTGRIHLGRQDLSQLQTRKMKGLKRGRDEDEDAAREGGADGNEDDEVEDESGDDDDAFDGISDDDDEGGAELAMSDDGEDDGVRDPISPKRPRLAA